MRRQRGSKPRPIPVDRTVVWVGSSLDDLRAMPVEVRRLMGAALHWAQAGGVGPGGSPQLGLHPAARKMKGDLAEVVEIRADADGEVYRAMYTAKLGGTIYVLHAFQKKSKRGIATPIRELDLIRARLSSARDRERRIAKGRIES